MSGISRGSYQRALGHALGAVVLASAFFAPILYFGSDEQAIASAEVPVQKKPVPIRRVIHQRQPRSVVTMGSFWGGVWDDLTQIVDFDDPDVVGRFDPYAAAYIDHFGTNPAKRSPIRLARSISSGPLVAFSDIFATFRSDYVEPLFDDLSDYVSSGKSAASDLYVDASQQVSGFLRDY